MLPIQNRILSLLLIASSASFAQTLPLDPAVRTGKLSNGFTYYIRHNTEPKHRVVLYLANKIGSIQEDDNQRGLAHFMEHMSFNGTKHYPKNQLIEYLQKSGVRFGADLNAYTSFTETVYQLPLPSDDTSIVRNGLQIMRDWAADATLETEEIDKERGVVLEEKRLRLGAGQRMQDSAFPLQMNHSRYAVRLPIGTEEVLKTFTPATLKKFYKDWYRPDQQALIVVGDIDVNAIEQQIKKLFGDLKNPAVKRPVQQYTIPLTGKDQFKILTDPEQTTTQISITIKQPELAMKTKADFRDQLIRILYNQALAGRFRELAAKSNPPFTQAGAGMQGFMGGLDAFSVNIVPKPGRTEEAFNAVWTEVIRLQQTGVTTSELERAKTSWLTRMDNAVKESSKTPSSAYVKEYLEYFLRGAAAPGITAEAALTKELIAGITLQDLNTAVAKAIKDTDRDIFIYAPEKERTTLPGETTVNSWIAKVKREKLSPWKDEGSQQTLLSTLPVAGKVIKREKMDSIAMTIYTLNNGVKVWTKATDFRNEEITFTAFSEGGTSLYGDEVFLSATNAVQLMVANGVSTFTPVQLSKMLTGRSVQVQPYIQERYEGISGGATPKDLETALQLTYLYFTAPRKDTAIFHNIISSSKAAIANRHNNPEAMFADTVNLVLGQYHYRRQPITVSRMDSIDLDKAYNIYKERFANAGDFTFVFTGNIDTATFIPLIERYLGSLPAAANREQAKGAGIPMPEGKISKTVYKGKDNKATIRLYYSGKYQFNEANNTQLSALGTILQYRMTSRIRELEGGAYSPQAGVSYNKKPQSRYTFSIQITCASGNVEKLITAVQEEIEKIKTDGPTADEIGKFMAERTRAAETQISTNAYWRGYIVYALQNDEPVNGVLHPNALLNTITIQSIQQAARQYIDPDNYIRLILMPEP
jgi:zinc protease